MVGTPCLAICPFHEASCEGQPFSSHCVAMRQLDVDGQGTRGLLILSVDLDVVEPLNQPTNPTAPKLLM